jgi:hypothetical protein
MIEQVRSFVWTMVAAVSLAAMAGCSGTAGYTRSAADMTPQVEVVAGDNQSTPINTAYSLPMKVRFQKNGDPLVQHTITFSAPESGASGTFPGGALNVTTVTDGAGYAVAPVFTANGTKGSYTVLAWNASYQNTFHLTNQ